MADKFEREIEEILEKLGDKLPPGDGGAEPISIASRRKAKARATPPGTPRPNPFGWMDPTAMLLAGAGIMFGGLVLSNFWEPLIWASFGGVVLFIGAFLWSLKRRPRGGTAQPAKGGVYWRDRYIEYGPTKQPAGQRIKSWLRRK